MTRPNPLKRLTLSRQTLHKYENLPGGTTDSPEWLLGQIREEVTILRELMAKHPDHALTIGDLIKRYEAMASRVKTRAH